MSNIGGDTKRPLTATVAAAAAVSADDADKDDNDDDDEFDDARTIFLPATSNKTTSSGE